MNRSMMDFWVGLFVVLGMVATMFIALRVANTSAIATGDMYTVTAAFDNIGNLKLRAPVKSSGVVVGRVQAITYDTTQHRAVVTVGLDERYRFSADAAMSILTTGLLGEQYIGIQNGADDVSLQEGDMVWLTSSAVVLESLIGEFIYGSQKKAQE
jgi:phospholipid/cholesterol/gamma-HCH transport system substrate-binding protein